MIAQKNAEYRVRAVTDGFRVLDKDQHNRGTYATRQAAEDHILELTRDRAQARACVRDLAQAGAVLLLALALLLTPLPVGAHTCTHRHGTAVVYRAGKAVRVETKISTCAPTVRQGDR